MCKLKSAIILKDRIFVPDYDSHSEMLEELGIKDDYLGASKKFVRVELSPRNGDVFSDIDGWELNIDQDITPEWFNKYEWKPRVVEAVKEWAKLHIHIGIDGLKISAGENHYIKDCKGVSICDSASVKSIRGSASVEYICDSASVKSICGSASVEYICDSASVKSICDSASVKSICDSASVKSICGSASVEYICGSASVKSICDSASVKSICDSASVEYICDSASVEYICDSASVKSICDSASVESICDSASVKSICDSASVKSICGSAVVSSSDFYDWKNKTSVILANNATFKDNYEKVIYQAGDYKLISVENNTKIGEVKQK